MKFYKFLENGKIVQYGITSATVPSPFTEITEAEYTAIIAGIKAHEQQVSLYVQQINEGTITVADVPATYREEVQRIIDNQPEAPNNSYGIDDDTYNQIIDDYTLELLEMMEGGELDV